MKRTALKRRTPLRSKKWGLKSKVGLSRGTTFLKRRMRLRKQSSNVLSVIERAIWGLCKALVRILHPNTCYTCGRPGLKGRNWQTGHMWKKSSLGAFMKYDLRILRPQCYYCNILLDGNEKVFERKMRAEIGEEKWAELLKDKKTSVQSHSHYLEVYRKYQELYEELSAIKDNC